MSPPAKLKILVVDDEQVVLDYIDLILNCQGYQVSKATDGIKGLESLEAELPDMVLTDITMPDMEGIEFIRKARRLAPDVPIIAMSGHPVGQKFLTSARLLGVKATLTKPFSRGTLVECVQKILGR